MFFNLYISFFFYPLNYFFSYMIIYIVSSFLLSYKTRFYNNFSITLLYSSAIFISCIGCIVFIIIGWIYTVGYQKSSGRFFFKQINCIILLSSDRRNMKHSTLESSNWDASNGDHCIFLGSIDNKLLLKVSKMKNVNNFPSINARKIKIPPFNVSGYDDSKKLYFIFLQ